MKSIKSTLIAIITTILSILTIVSCEKSGDTTSPVIHLNAPTEGAELMAGKDVHFDMELSDNEMLKSYKVEIHNNMESPHGHEKAIRPLHLKSGSYYSYQQSWDVSDKKNAHIHHHEIEIPEDVIPGAYHFMVYCTDASGNESHIALNISIVPHDGSDDDDDDHDHDH
jgi:hypothetical protein